MSTEKMACLFSYSDINILIELQLLSSDSAILKGIA